MIVPKPLLFCLAIFQYASTQNLPAGVTSPLASTCGPSSANIVCIDRYASVMPYNFYRKPSAGTTDVSFDQTNVPNDTSFGLVGKADFLVFDQQRGLEILGSNPTYDKVFTVSDAVHEAPVYVPSLNKLFLSNLAPPAGVLKPQLVIDLNRDPPTLSNFFSDPPVYAPNGGTFYNGLIYWGASGGNDSIGGVSQRAGIQTLDPHTNKTTTLLNNYYGFYFNTVDDLFVDRTGAIWFTDPEYSWFNRLTDTPPQLFAASYRFDPKTGAATMVDDTLVQPNGIAMSPDGLNIYISDTGAETGSIVKGGPPGSPFNQTGPRAVYKYDVCDGGTHITNKRPIWYAQDWVPDGLKVAANGFVVTATGPGVDILDPYGVLVVRIQTDFVVQNIAWVGAELTEMWLVGQGGLARVRFALAGQDLAAI
jgi:sugar lactone lactonase YvrE